MTLPPLTDLAACFQAGNPRGITSVCSAHPLVLRAAVQYARDTAKPILIEATCNQVNHEGGYTGLAPRDFMELVASLMDEEECPSNLVIMGGDHLGPNPWRNLPANSALEKAGDMIDAYIEAGFRKIHLDASMGCAGEPSAVDDATAARRAAQLAHRAEAAAKTRGLSLPVYVIGTEVPPPGGADHVLDTVAPTLPDAVRQTVDLHRSAFEEAGLRDAFLRIIALVVQPGVEFGNRNVVLYAPEAAAGLTTALREMPALVFEAHSTDYQGKSPLVQLVRDGFAILKVGPELTFALRESLYALDLIASDLLSQYGERPLYRTMERVMCSRPEHWKRHYQGSSTETHVLRHYSLSDRIRYYWNDPDASKAVAHLFACLEGARVPLPLMKQHFRSASEHATKPLCPQDLVLQHIREVLLTYHAASSQDTPA